MARTTNFSDLNFDCVLLIFKLLTNLEDQVNLARCCQLFRAAFVYLNRERFEEIVDNDIKLKTLDEWRSFLWMCGANVKTLQSYYDDEHPMQLLPMVCKYCTNLESITLHNVTVAKSQPFLLQMLSLKKVHVRNYKSTSKDLIKSLLRLPHIKSLGLDCFDRREIQELRKFKNLEELQLFGDITTSDFVAIMKSMRNLRILQLRNAKKFLTTSTLKQLIAYCRHLEKLSFFEADSSADLSLIAQFSNLKYLQLSCPDNLKTRLFKALASKSAANLQYLILHRKRWVNEEQARYIGALHELKLLICKLRDDRCLNQLAQLKKLEWLSVQCSRDIGEVALLGVLCSNLRLRFLNICYCTTISDDFIVNALDILATRSSYQTLELYAAATDIRRDILERKSADQRIKMLHINFECSNGIFCYGNSYYDDPEFDR